MLMLKCVHDPCVNCAASTYAEQIHIKGQSNQVRFKYKARFMYAKFADSKLYWITQQSSNLLIWPILLSNLQLNTPIKSLLKMLVTGEFKLRKPYSPRIQKKLFTTVKIIMKNKLHTIALIAGKTFVLNVQFMVFFLSHQGNHKDHNVKMIKKAISEVKNVYM